MLMTTLLAVICRPSDRPTVAAYVNRDLAQIHEWCGHWCMLLNPKKRKALAVSRSRTVYPPHGDLGLAGVPILSSPSLDILGVRFNCKLTFESCACCCVTSLAENRYLEDGKWSEATSVLLR